MDPSLTSWKLVGWMASVVVSGSTMAISMPLLVHGFASKYFVLFLSSFEFVILFGMGILAFALCPIRSSQLYTPLINDGSSSSSYRLDSGVKKKSPRQYLALVYSGIANTFSALLLTYASDPSNTPVELQSILASLIIIPSFCMRKWYLKRETDYDYKNLTGSVVFLLGGTILGVVPLFQSGASADDDSQDSSSSGASVVLWMFLYTLGTVLRAVSNIFQEEYYMTTPEYSTKAKIFVVFVSRAVQLVTVLLLFWIDPIFQRHSFADSWADFTQSWKEGFVSSSYGLLFQLYILSFFVFFYSSITLNAVSTNISVISSMMITPCMMLFFQVFSQLNPGLHFAWWVTLSCLACNLLSTYLWVRAEKNE